MFNLLDKNIAVWLFNVLVVILERFNILKAVLEIPF